MSEMLERVEAKHPAYPEFVKWLREHSKVEIRDRTLANYLKQLYTMRNYGLDPSNDNPDFRAILQKLTKRKLASNTMNLFRHILRYWALFKDVEFDEALFKKRKSERKRKLHSDDLITLEEVCDIVEHTKSNAVSAYLLCLWDSGARPNELTRMKVADVQEDQHGFVFTIRDAKNTQSRRVVRLIEPKSIARFQQWWAIHPKRDTPTAPVFINQRGNSYSSKTITYLLKLQHQERLNRDNGKAPLNLYLFRFSRATQLLRDKVLTEMEVRRRMGHKPGSRVLEKVYAILSEEDQAEAELRAMGIETGKREKHAPIICPNCGASNDYDSVSCYRCRIPLTEEEVIRQQQIIAQSPIFQEMIANNVAHVLDKVLEERLKAKGVLE